MKYAILMLVLFSSMAVASPPDNRPPFKGGGNVINAEDIGRAESDARSDSRSSSTSGSSSSSNSSVSGSSRSGAIASGGSAKGGKSVSSIDIEVEGDDYDVSAASAAAVYSAYCQQGASAQGLGGGGGVSSADVLCDLLKMADRELLAYNQQREWCIQNAEPCDVMAMQDHLDLYNKFLKDAGDIMDRTKHTGEASKVAGQLVLPFAMLWVLFLL